MNEKVELFNTIFNAMIAKEDIKSLLTSEGEKRLATVIAAACQTAEKLEKTLAPKEINPEDEIWCNDVVILSINNGPATRYFLSLYPKESYYNSVNECDVYPNLRDGRKMENFYFLDAHTPFGQSLFGKHVGEEYYYEEPEGREHSIKIISRQRTTISIKINICEIEADITYENKSKRR